MADTFAAFLPGATWSPDGRTIAVPLARARKLPRYMLYPIRVAGSSVSELFPSSSPIAERCGCLKGTCSF